MATSTPSSLFLRLTNTWRYLTLRCDVDDIVLELLGRFSLDKIYASAGDRPSYQRLVITLLYQLKIIFDLQRLTIPPENTHAGWYLGYLVSWEVAVRAVEFVLQTVAEGREYLWEHRPLRDGYLAEFLLSALRVLALHPKAPPNHGSKGRRERFGRIHGALEQVFDSYPGPKSFLLEVCKEVTNQLHIDPDILVLPPRLRRELPTLTTHMYPLPPCLQSESISTIVPKDGEGNWLTQLLALRDVSLYVISASIQYAANRETQDMRLQSNSAKLRNVVLTGLDHLRLPPHMSRVDVIATFSSYFRIILPDTLNLQRQNTVGSRVDDCELDALDALCTRLMERQVIHRVSDRDMTHGINQVIRNILVHDDPSGRYASTRPALYVLNCPESHLAGASQLRSSGIQLPPDLGTATEIRLPPNPGCPQCGGTVTIAREVPGIRQIWEIVEPLRPDVDAINVERHVSSQFQLLPPNSETAGIFYSSSASSLGLTPERPRENYVPIPGRVPRAELPSPTLIEPRSAGYPPAVSPLTPGLHRSAMTLRSEPSRSGALAEAARLGVMEESDPSDLTHGDSSWATEPPPFSSESAQVRRQVDVGRTGQTHTARTVPLVSPPSAGKHRSKWRQMFTTQTKKPQSNSASGDSSSLSSSTLESQRLDEISLVDLTTNQHRSGTKQRISKNINVHLSHNSTLCLFWTQFQIQVWDVGSSPPSQLRKIEPASTCLVAAVGREILAFIIGNRDQKLTLRIINLFQPSANVIEYRIPSSLWCRSIAIDKEDNCVVVGFDNATVRFFNARRTEEPLEHRLHALGFPECKACPPGKPCPSVDTLSFSSDGLSLIAGMRSSKTGVIQTYTWRFPFYMFQELFNCRYPVPLHESEDNGISSALIRPELDGDQSLVCITTWTQSGTPVLIQPQDGHRSEIRGDTTGKHRIGSRIQCASFSHSGKELFLVNDKGYVFQVSNLNSSPMDVRRIASTKELTIKSDSFAMSVMGISDEEHVVVAWADSQRSIAWVKKIPVVAKSNIGVYDVSSYPYETAVLPGSGAPPVELPATERRPSELSANGEDRRRD